MGTLNSSNNMFNDRYRLVVKNNVKLDAKLKLKFMNTLWRHENAGIIGFLVRNVIIVNNNKTKVVLFVYTPDITSRESLHTRYQYIDILISWDQ